MKADIGIHFTIAIIIWLVSWTVAIEISHSDLNNHPNKSKSNEYDTTMLLDDDDDDDVYNDTNTTANSPKITQLYNSGVIKRTDAELTCQKTFMYDSRELAHCYDDRNCKTYGDCCRDSVHYAEQDQSLPAGRADGASSAVYNNSRYGCYGVGGEGLMMLMIGKCPRDADRGVRDKCENGGGEDTASGYPVTADTGKRHVYRNAYCAWCNGERQRVVYWKPVFECYGPGGRTTTAPVLLEDASDGTLLYRDGRWYYADYGDLKLLSCRARVRPPSDLAGAPEMRPCGVFRKADRLVDGCPAGAPVPLARACASHAYVLFEYGPGNGTTARAFRNADCARCNNVTVARLTCEPPPPPLLATFAFGSLFAVRATGARRDACAPDELYDLPAARCRNVFRDELSGPCGGVSVTFGPNEYDGRSLDNGTAYVYAYKKRVRYRNRGTPASGVPLEVCADDADGVRPPTGPGEQPTSTSTAYAAYLTYAGVAGSSVSAVALVAHLALFCSGPEPNNLPEKNLASLAVGLLLGYGSYLSIALRAVQPGPGLPCLVSALAMHFGFLAAFAWMFVMSVDVWIVLHASTKKLRVSAGKRNGRFAAYSAFAWLAPAAFTGLAAAMQLSAAGRTAFDLRPDFQHDCWFQNPRSLVALFVVPAGVTIAANYVSFAGAVRLIATSGDRFRSSGSCSSVVNRSRKNLKIYARLSLMMGLAWAFGLAGAVTDNDAVWTLYTVLNSLQGAFIFLAFDCNRISLRALSVFSKLPSSVSDTQNTTTTPLSASN